MKCPVKKICHHDVINKTMNDKFYQNLLENGIQQRRQNYNKFL